MDNSVVIARGRGGREVEECIQEINGDEGDLTWAGKDTIQCKDDML